MVKGCSFHADIFDENKLPLGEKTFSVKLPNAEEEGVASPSVFHLLLDSQTDIFSLKHESSIFRSVIQPYMWFLHDGTG